MTQPLDLDAVQERHDAAFSRTWQSEPGETEEEFAERTLREQDYALWDTAKDVPALVAEIRRLRPDNDLYAGWMAAIDALEAEAKAWQRLGDTARWSMLEVAAATLRRLDERPKAPEVGQGTYTREVHDLGDIVLTYEAWEPSP